MQNRTMEFEQITSQNPERIADRPDVFVIVTAVAARNEAEALFKKLGRKENSYAFGEIVK